MFPSLVDAIPKRAAIERDLPVEQMQRWARREGNRKKPIYELHKWWARRLGTTFRMLLLGATTADRSVEDLVKEAFYRAHDLSGLTVLDPFMGGGTSLVEAAKCGAHVIGVDIDPVACFVTSRELEAVDPKRLQRAFEVVSTRVRGKILDRYKTRLPDGRTGDVIYAFWVDEIACPSCGKSSAAHPHYQLAREDAAQRQTVICRHCGTLKSVKLDQEGFRCGSCEAFTRIKAGPIQGGRFVCPSCDERHVFSDLSDTESLPEQRLFALDVLAEDGERLFKAADEGDLKRYSKSSRLWESGSPEAKFAPNELIPADDRYDNRPIIYGYTRYRDLFNARQLLSLCEIAWAVAELEDPIEKKFLALAFSDCLASNNMFCSFAFDYRKLTPLFGLHAYRRVVRPVENNVWGVDQGRGTFSRCVAKVIRGKEYGLEPYEFRYRGRQPVPVKTGDKVSVELGKKLSPSSSARSSGRVLNCSAASLEGVADESVDLVLTDPPYYDNLPYSELSDFYHVWLKRVLGGLYEGSGDEHTPWKESLFVGRKGRDRTAEHRTFVDNLSAALRECGRVLRPDGIMVFTYHHGDASAWKALGAALLKSSFRVMKVLPVRSEGQSAFHSYGGSLKWDAVLVCRKRARRVGSPRSSRVRDYVQRIVAYWQTRLGSRVKKPDLLSLSHAIAIQFLSRYVWSPELETLLDLVLTRIASEAQEPPRRKACQ